MNKNKSIDSIAAVFAFATHTRKLIAALALSLMWGCSSKTEEEPAQPAAQPQAVAPAPQVAAPEQPMAAEAPKQAMEAMRSESPTAAEAKTAESAPAAAAPSVANAEGEEVFNGSCMMCHKMGVGGAPKIGDKTDWEPRISQGIDVLYKHALEGFKGRKGMMPPRGGNTRLKDDQVKAAVDYMVGTAK